MTPTDTVAVPEVSEILTWPQAVFGAAVLLAMFVVPQVLTYLQGRQTRAQVEAVKHQTENNSGSTMRDAVDRIEGASARTEQALAEHIEYATAQDAETNRRLTALEQRKGLFRR